MANEEQNKKHKTVQEFEKSIGFICKMGGYIGYDIFRSDYKPSVGAFTVIAFAAVYVVASVAKFMTTKSILNLAQCTICIGMDVQMIIKAITAIGKREHFVKCHDLMFMLHNKSGGHEIKREYLLKVLRVVNFLFRFMMVLYFWAGVVFVSSGLVPNLFIGPDEPIAMILPAKLPYTNEKTRRGYAINGLFHLGCSFCTVLGLWLYDNILMICIVHYYAIAGTIKISLDDIDTILVKSDQSDREIVDAQLKDVYKWHQCLNEDLTIINVVMKWVNFVQILTTMVGISSGLFLIMMPSDNWYQVYPIFVASFFQLCLYSVMGSVVSVTNENLMYDIYQFKWEKLTMPQIKDYAFFICHVQQDRAIMIGATAKLNVHTGLQIMKTIYSVFTVIYACVEGQEIH